MSRENTRQINAPQHLYPLAGSGAPLTVDATAGGVQFPALPADTQYVQLQVRDAEVAMTTDGTAPTASGPGFRLAPGQMLLLSKQEAAAAKFIRTGATSATIWSESRAY